MGKEKTEEFQASDFEMSDCIEVLRNLQGRTRCYVHLFPEMSKESCDTWAVIDKEALERAIQALQEKAKRDLCFRKKAAIKFQEEVLEDADVSMLRSCYSCISHLCRCLRDGSSIDGMVSVYASMSLPKCDLTDEEKYAREKYANLFEVANSVLRRVLRLNHE